MNDNRFNIIITDAAGTGINSMQLCHLEGEHGFKEYCHILMAVMRMLYNASIRQPDAFEMATELFRSPLAGGDKG